MRGGTGVPPVNHAQDARATFRNETPPKRLKVDTAHPRRDNFNLRGDVAELADAQVSEACDGDIVEVQVLSSAPFLAQEASPQPQIS